MNSPSTLPTVSLLVVFLGTVFQADTLAYLDPGTGSMVIQGMIAALAAAGYTLRVYWTRIRSWTRRSGARVAPQAEGSAVERR